MKRKTIFLPLISLLVLTLCFSCGDSKQVKNNQTDTTKKMETIWQIPEWTKNCNIYEVNIRQYTPEGTFKAFEKHLQRLKEMGVDILWFMPIQQIGDKNKKGSIGSYYSVRDYKSINPEFGSLDDFKSIVKKAHELGMYVLIDWVPNHTSWDNVWIEAHKDWYTQDSLGNIIMPPGTDWSDVADLNYNNQEMRKAMIDAMVYWVNECGIDGFRVDMAGLVPLDFWVQARPELEKVKNLFMLAEWEDPDFHPYFDMTYSWEFHHKLNDIAKNHANNYALDSVLGIEFSKFKPENYRMRFISNHDENSWKGSEYERMGDAVEVMAVLCYTIQGMPLTYSGQEAPLKRILKFFDKDQIDWQKYYMADFYKTLNKLKHENRALWNGQFGGTFEKINTSDNSSVFAFIRQKDNNKVVVILNTTKNQFDATLMSSEIDGNYIEYFTNKQVTLQKDAKISLKPWEYMVYIKN